MFIDKKEHQALVSERDQAVEKATKLEADVTAKSTEISTLTASLETVTAESRVATEKATALEATVTAKETEIKTLTEKVKVLSGLPGAKSVQAALDTESPEQGQDINEVLAKMTITKRLDYLARTKK